ncbi:hypothetical protein [Demequina sp. NBRC 110051]|uniref:hypothetical protein n=1 Tax=Demequina sp. NBRC 110051 TaxID=1570340 RepID=UPI0009FFDFB6|nr:hypothetical protein [Demequina sp. NBRC 110051]
MADFSGGPGFAAFVATFLMVAAAVVLMLSLSRHLRKVRTRPPEDDENPTTASAADTTETGDTAATEGDEPEAPRA